MTARDDGRDGGTGVSGPDAATQGPTASEGRASAGLDRHLAVPAGLDRDLAVPSMARDGAPPAGTGSDAAAAPPGSSVSPGTAGPADTGDRRGALRADIGAVVIGRNEGARLVACLAALAQGAAQPARVVYVDSGSTDGSRGAARAAGAEVVALDTGAPFTAARARNAGLAVLRVGDAPGAVQFVDGDCTVRPDWIAQAAAFLDGHPRAGIVCGRRRERHPEASAYNRLCDAEWNTPVGRALACGGDALMRMAALDQVGGFDPALIAGEEPELCVRLRARGWEVWRIDAEMTLHDAAMTRFAQFWRRARRAGHAFAEGAAMHGRAPERHGVAATRRALAWGVALPLTILAAAAAFGPWALAALAIYPAQVARLALRDGNGGGGGGSSGRGRAAWERAGLLTAAKFAEAAGVLEYHLNRRRGQRTALIEYQ